MHPLQRHIMHELIRHSERRYAELKPEDVEGNHFSYHLRAIRNVGLVEQLESGRYRLTPAGRYLAEGLSLKTMSPRAQPHIFLLLAIRSDSGAWLLYRRRREPLAEMVGFPGGKLHTDDRSLAEAAVRELAEKTGLTGIPLQHRGDGYIRIQEAEDTVSHILFHLFFGSTTGDPELSGPPEGEPFWGHPKDIPPRALIPSVTPLIELLDSRNDHFFTELSYKR